METEASRQRAEALADINGTLLQATDEIAILNALAQYTVLHDAAELLLIYLHDEPELFSNWEIVAEWHDGQAVSNKQAVPLLPNHAIGSEISHHLMDDPAHVLLIEDIAADNRFGESNRKNWIAAHQTRAAAILPLHSGGRYQGNLWIGWFNAHQFSDEERYIYTQLLQTLPSVVATRRAYLAEQEARHERELLYQASEAINFRRNCQSGG
jgi:GAF domain-containing protein